MGLLDNIVGGIMKAVPEPTAPKLRGVELVRQRIVRGQLSEIVKLRTYVSSIDGNAYAVERLRGNDGDALLADITELIMAHLGHSTSITRADDGHDGRASQARKASRGSL